MFKPLFVICSKIFFCFVLFLFLFFFLLFFVLFLFLFLFLSSNPHWLHLYRRLYLYINISVSFKDIVLSVRFLTLELLTWCCYQVRVPSEMQSGCLMPPSLARSFLLFHSISFHFFYLACFCVSLFTLTCLILMLLSVQYWAMPGVLPTVINI